MNAPMLPVSTTYAELRKEITKRLAYYIDTGLFVWIDCKKPGRNGMPAGTKDKDGYLEIKIGQKRYKAHRLAWLYVYGHFPKAQIDHVNGDVADNRIANLREATNSENNCNRGPLSRNRLGLKGVRKHGNRFQALICKNGKQTLIGSFETKEEANHAYRNAARTLHGDFCYSAQ